MPWFRVFGPMTRREAARSTGGAASTSSQLAYSHDAPPGSWDVSTTQLSSKNGLSFKGIDNGLFPLHQLELPLSL